WYVPLTRTRGVIPRVQTQGTYETQQTGTSYSDASSIARFPHLQFSLHKVIPLSALYTVAKLGKDLAKSPCYSRPRGSERSRTDTVRVKQGFDAGQQVSILKLILADDQGAVCKVTAWIDTADAWGGVGPSPRLKRGDSVCTSSARYLFHVISLHEIMATVTLSASPYNWPIAEDNALCTPRQ
ncbi:hypothetical protein L210DRAFT_2666956, partial [Boletus edulis BED1]